MSYQRERDNISAIRGAAIALDDDDVLDRIVADIGDASLVLLGEASHGTQEFYAWRARITRRLIEQRGFAAVAIEGDWPDAYEVNRFVRGEPGAAVDARAALGGFERFPTWMWRNTVVTDFVAWLQQHNQRIDDAAKRTGFYGLDLYSLHASMRAVVGYLEQRDPVAARAARQSYACFEEYGEDSDHYGWAAAKLGEETCEDAVARELAKLRARRAELIGTQGNTGSDAHFHAVQNARLALNAERYYRTMFRGRVASWNVRDEHMAETLAELLQHLRGRRLLPKVVVWAHNSHLGDARATDSADDHQLNLGQLVREKHGSNAKLIGFTTHTGTVVAADDWGQPARVKRVRPALDGSIEDLFHLTGLGEFYLPLRPGSAVHRALREPRLERAIGVIYRPDTERISHYFNARVAEQFDAIIHLDHTRGVDPLDTNAAWDPAEVPETFPSGM